MDTTDSSSPPPSSPAPGAERPAPAVNIIPAGWTLPEKCTHCGGELVGSLFLANGGMPTLSIEQMLAPSASAAPAPRETGSEPFDLDTEMNELVNAVRDGREDDAESAQDAIYDEFKRLRAERAAGEPSDSELLDRLDATEDVRLILRTEAGDQEVLWWRMPNRLRERGHNHLDRPVREALAALSPSPSRDAREDGT